MRLPALLLLFSVAAAAASALVYGPVLSDMLLLCVLCAVAAAILLVQARLRRQQRYIIIDGSNVMHWGAGEPSLETVRQVLKTLIEQGYVPVVWFDANVGYRVSDRYLGSRPLSRALGVEERQIFIAPKGTPADPLLLDDAETLQAKVVTNDRFHDWSDSHPQITKAGFLVSGRLRHGEVVLSNM